MVLLLGLMLLAALSLLTLATASDSRSQIRVAGNSADAADNQAAANAALSWAEDWLMGLDGNTPPPVCTAPCPAGSLVYPADTLPADAPWPADAWWQSVAFGDGTDPVSSERLTQRGAWPDSGGRWVIGLLHWQAADPDVAGSHATGYYRIMARGATVTGAPPVVAQTIVARPWGDSDWKNPWPPAPGNRPLCLSILPDEPCGRLAWQGEN